MPLLLLQLLYLRRGTCLGREIFTLPIVVHVGELSKEEQLVFALRASTDMALEERLAWVATFTHDKGPGSLSVSLSLLFSFLFYYP